MRDRWLTLVRFAWGSLLVVRPDTALQALGGTPTPSAHRVLRALGARHVLQAAAEVRLGPRIRRWEAAVDAVHGLSAAGLAAVDHRWRRPALVDAALACGLAAALAVSGGGVPREHPDSTAERRRAVARRGFGPFALVGAAVPFRRRSSTQREHEPADGGPPRRDAPLHPSRRRRR